ncbi:L-aspartate oxidase [Bacillus sp. CHD6a]|uniref:L-aspartate oxidase n=1 Tax=Bacillus sp. CHD6a TaxID=1643452 RepID=UPI0006CD58BF|nr:L-aspartate oxidase [Bacillus sp. CHD6a]KPB05156.1 L-aspartate oxidase [Bacillus sp. CHD6a]
MSSLQRDVIVVGSGLSALLTANYLSEHMNVIIFTKSSKNDNNSFLAQGGVACAIEHTDSWQLHYEDTLAAGCYHNEEDAVELLTKCGPGELKALIQNGMQFDRDALGDFSLGMEGAHSKRRILHAGGDQTGKQLMEWLQSKLSKKVLMVEHETVIKLHVQNDQCCGVQTLNSIGERTNYFAEKVILATGGAGSLYPYTSNNENITGMALSLAYQAGATLTDLEFMQFHPTMLSVDGKAVGLVSEAVRGEGAFLQDGKGHRFMENVHPLKDLAPRDVVSRAIFQELDNSEKVYLNITDVEQFQTRFPAITKLCTKHGIDLKSNLIPVVPGAHFYMGGIHTTVYGETTLKGLYAVGEAACNGVHGANRLASNSLLETIVFSKTLADHLLTEKVINSHLHWHQTSTGRIVKDLLIQERAVPLPSKEEIQQMMMKHAGIVRHREGLLELKGWLGLFQPYCKAIDHLTDSLKIEEIETIHMLQLCYLVTEASLQREESRGAHFRSDFPVAKDSWRQVRILHVQQEESAMGKENEIDEYNHVARDAASFL